MDRPLRITPHLSQHACASSFWAEHVSLQDENSARKHKESVRLCAIRYALNFSAFITPEDLIEATAKLEVLIAGWDALGCSAPLQEQVLTAAATLSIRCGEDDWSLSRFVSDAQVLMRAFAASSTPQPASEGP